MPYAVSGDCRIYYEEHGAGVPVIMLHGFTVDSRMWLPNVESLKENFRIILPDARGHGKSDAPETGYSRDDRVEDLRHLAAHLNLESFHLVGLSYGGATAIGYALKYPKQLRSFTLVSSGAAGYSNSKRFSKLDDIAREQGVEAAKKIWINWSMVWYKEHCPEVGELLVPMMKEHSGAVWNDPMRGEYPRTIDLDYVHQIKKPVLIMAGERDRLFVPLAKLLVEKIPAAKYIEFTGAGHMLNMEQPTEFNEQLKVFIKSTEATFQESVR